MNWYSISKKGEALFTENPLVQAKNSKQALEKFTGKKVKRVMGYYDHFDYCVFISNEKGQYYRDRRKRCYYAIL